MARGAPATLAVQVVVFGFDPEPGTPPNRALHVLTIGSRLPQTEVDRDERFAAAARRAVDEAGAPVEGGGRRGGRGASRLTFHLVGLGDDPVRSGQRTVNAWFYTTAPFGESAGGARWSPAGRGLKLDAAGNAALRAALEQLRRDTRVVSGAAALLGDVFTGDDLLRLHVALHGGPKGSERTFRRRVQELRDSGVLRPVRPQEVAGLRERVVRFRSPAGTGGRPPELLRYAGSGGEEEQLAGLRARRST